MGHTNSSIGYANPESVTQIANSLSTATYAYRHDHSSSNQCPGRHQHGIERPSRDRPSPTAAHRRLNHCVSIASEYARSHPRAARDVAAGAMVALAGVGAFHAYSPLLAVMVLSGTLKVAYSAVTIALIVAAVRGSVSLAANVRRAGCEIIRRADTTMQKYFCSSPGSIFGTRVLTVERAGLFRLHPHTSASDQLR
jgi:hypothetical protein